MTDREILDELKQIQAEAQDALQRENKAALDKALADYDSKFDKFARQLESVEAAIKTAAVLPGCRRRRRPRSSSWRATGTRCASWRR